MNELITVSLYLKNIKRPIKFEIDSRKQIEELYKDLLVRDVVKFGPCIFQRSEFIYLIEE